MKPERPDELTFGMQLWAASLLLLDIATITGVTATLRTQNFSGTETTIAVVIISVVMVLLSVGVVALFIPMLRGVVVTRTVLLAGGAFTVVQAVSQLFAITGPLAIAASITTILGSVLFVGGAALVFRPVVNQYYLEVATSRVHGGSTLAPPPEPSVGPPIAPPTGPLPAQAPGPNPYLDYLPGPSFPPQPILEPRRPRPSGMCGVVRWWVATIVIGIVRSLTFSIWTGEDLVFSHGAVDATLQLTFSMVAAILLWGALGVSLYFTQDGSRVARIILTVFAGIGLAVGVFEIIIGSVHLAQGMPVYGLVELLTSLVVMALMVKALTVTYRSSVNLYFHR